MQLFNLKQGHYGPVAQNLRLNANQKKQMQIDF